MQKLARAAICCLPQMLAAPATASAQPNESDEAAAEWQVPGTPWSDLRGGQSAARD